jgi:hypothetical protein
MPSLRRLARRPASVPIPRTAGEVAVALYLAVLVRFAADGSIRPEALGSSPAGVANGHLARLLTSGLVIDGPAVPQIAALGVTLAVALRRLGPARTWRAALVAHVGATVAAYGGVALLAVVDRRLVAGVMHAPDYGISVVLTGELGALAAAHKPKLMPAAIVGLTSITAATSLRAHGVDTLTLANLEHLLGFLIGATFTRLHPSAAMGGARVRIRRHRQTRRGAGARRPARIDTAHIAES